MPLRAMFQIVPTIRDTTPPPAHNPRTWHCPHCDARWHGTDSRCWIQTCGREGVAAYA